MDLSSAAEIAQVVSAVAVAGGVGFGILQLRQFRDQRRDAAAFAYFQQWDVDQQACLDAVYTLPDGASAETIERSPELQRAANAIYVQMEQLGIMAFHDLIPVATLNEWIGGAVRISWKKLRPWIEAKRATAGSQRPGEWFQWLAERLAELPARDEKVGAFAAHRGRRR